jgi:hypothetical protein
MERSPLEVGEQIHQILKKSNANLYECCHLLGYSTVHLGDHHAVCVCVSATLVLKWATVHI